MARFTKITDCREPTPEESERRRKLQDRLGGWEGVDAAALKIASALEEAGISEDAEMCQELLRLVFLSIPNWIWSNQQKIRPVSSAGSPAESVTQCTQ